MSTPGRAPVVVPRWFWPAVVVCDLLVLAIYVWLISVGTWLDWPSGWKSYDALATAFRQGELALLAKPDPALLALPDPYDPAARQGISYPQDVSLYQGRFYLYFGPAPALILMVAKSIIRGPIGDQFLVFLFIASLLPLQTALIVRIRKRLFPNTPVWMLLVFIVVAGLMVPWPWMLSTPSVYGAAIVAGQFFFLAGLYLAVTAFEADAPPPWKMAIAGLAWGAAVASRVTLIVPIGFVLLVIAVGLAHRYAQAPVRGALVRSMAALGLVFGLGLACLGWYNWARFGSVFETGIKYQLAGLELQPYSSRTFSTSYIVQNLYNYILNPPRLKYPFPYLSPARGPATSVISGIHLPPNYRAQEITGLLFTAPFLALAFLPIIRSTRVRSWPRISETEARDLGWLTLALGGSFLVGLAFFLLFFWAAERYLADFLPSLVPLSFIGAWQLDDILGERPTLRAAYRFFLFTLIIVCAMVSILLAMSFNTDGFRQLNPVLWRQLSNLFRP